jgi:glycosyltransferase involved in cell wall biosynthesis
VKVRFTTDATAHSAYFEIAAAPPGGVTIEWTKRHEGDPARIGRQTGRRFFQTLRLPNLRIIGGLADADIVHSCQQLLLTRRPWVVDLEHGQPFVGTRFSRLENPFTRAVVNTVLSSASCRAVLPWTRTAAEAFMATFDPPKEVRQKISVVHPAIRSSADRAERPERRGCRLLFVANAPGYNVLLKGGRELVEAFRILRREQPDLSLTIVGPTPAAFESRCREISGLVLMGRVSRDALDTVYRDADLYVMPSLSDTFGMVFLEAMSHGLPVVAIDRPYTCDIVQDGVTGLLLRLPKTGLRWCDDGGRFTMESEEFIRRVIAADPNPALVRALVDALPALFDPAVRARLGAAARAEITHGKFSVGRRNTMLVDVYARASRRGAAR